MPVPNTNRATLHPIIREHVATGSMLYTDAHSGYRGLGPDFQHDFVDHAERYVLGHVHTNGLENFWNLFKRCVKGTHVSMEPFHVFRYLDSECFRFNNRELTDGERFATVAGLLAGKRLTYKVLTGNAEGRLADDAGGSGGMVN